MVLRIENVLVGALVTNQLGITADMLSKTTKDSGGRKEYSPGDRGWTVSLTSLYDPNATEGFSQAVGYLKNGTVLDILFGDPDTAYWTAEALIKKVDILGQKNELSEYNVDILGISDLDYLITTLITEEEKVILTEGDVGEKVIIFE